MSPPKETAPNNRMPVISDAFTTPATPNKGILSTIYSDTHRAIVRAPTFVQKRGKAHHTQALKDVKTRYPDVWVPGPENDPTLYSSNLRQYMFEGHFEPIRGKPNVTKFQRAVDNMMPPLTNFQTLLDNGKTWAALPRDAAGAEALGLNPGVMRLNQKQLSSYVHVAHIAGGFRVMDGSSTKDRPVRVPSENIDFLLCLGHKG